MQICNRSDPRGDTLYQVEEEYPIAGRGGYRSRMWAGCCCVAPIDRDLSRP